MGWIYGLTGLVLGYYLGLMHGARLERRAARDLNEAAKTLQTAVDQNQPPTHGAD